MNNVNVPMLVYLLHTSIRYVMNPSPTYKIIIFGIYYLSKILKASSKLLSNVSENHDNIQEMSYRY